jgi:radical SAM superfamily enzyme YgiQ (UPF0313 family)
MKVLCLSINALQNFPGLPKWNQSLSFAYLVAFYTTSKHFRQTEFISLTYYEDINNEKVIADLTECKFNILAISCYIWNIEKVLFIVEKVKEINSDIKIILGGPEFSYDSKDVFAAAPSIDVVVVGEGEVTFKEVLDYFHENNGNDLKDIKGTISKDHAGNVILSHSRAMIEDLDMIPSPYLNGIFDLTKIKNSLSEIETQRGCSFNCGYCNYQKGDNNKIRYFNLDRVEKELELILSHQPKQLFLMDPTFNFNKKRARSILSYIIEYNVNTTLNAEMMPDIMDNEIISLSRKAGLKIIEIGIQSLNPRAIKIMRRYRNEKKLFENIVLAVNEGLQIMPQIIFGLPGDNYESFLIDTFNKVYDLQTEELEINYLSILPQTKYRYDAEKYGIQYNNRSPYNIIQSNDFTKDEISLLLEFRKLVLVTLPLKRTINRINKVKQFDYHRLFLGFMNENNCEINDFVWPIQSLSDKDYAIATIDKFYEYTVAEMGNFLDQSIINELKRCKRHGQITLAAHFMHLHTCENVI